MNRQMQDIRSNVLTCLTNDEKELLSVGFDIMAEYAEQEDIYNENIQELDDQDLESLTQWDEEDWFAAEAVMCGVNF